METPKLGIANLLPIIMLAVEMGNVADKMGRTKGLARYMNVTSLLDETVDVLKVDFKQVKAEIADLTAEERAEIEQAIKEKFDIADDKLEGVIEKSIGIVEKQISVVVEAIDLYKGLKA